MSNVDVDALCSSMANYSDYSSLASSERLRSNEASVASVAPTKKAQTNE